MARRRVICQETVVTAPMQYYLNLMWYCDILSFCLRGVASGRGKEAGPQREILLGGKKTDFGPLCQGKGWKLGNDKKKSKKVFTGNPASFCIHAHRTTTNFMSAREFIGPPGPSKPWTH